MKGMDKVSCPRIKFQGEKSNAQARLDVYRIKYFKLKKRKEKRVK